MTESVTGRSPGDSQAGPPNDERLDLRAFLPCTGQAQRSATTMESWIHQVLQHPELRGMGHTQRLDDLNLGLGWLYYALARILRPRNVVVVGSYRGFVPLIFGKGQQDNLEGGRVYFIDPSFVDDFWKDASAVRRYFETFGVENVTHFLMTTQEFVESAAYRELADVGIAFIDGFHSEEQAAFDFHAVQGRLSPDALVLFHDSLRISSSDIYGPDRIYKRRVKCLIDKLKLDRRYQVFDLPFGEGLTLVRRAEVGPSESNGTEQRP